MDDGPLLRTVRELPDQRKVLKGKQGMPRTLIEPHKRDKRYVRRKGGKFTKSQDDVGRSLSVDRRKQNRTKVKSGEGDRGDR